LLVLWAVLLVNLLHGRFCELGVAVDPNEGGART